VNPKVLRTIFYCVLISEVPQYILHDSVLFCKLYYGAVKTLCRENPGWISDFGRENSPFSSFLDAGNDLLSFTLSTWLRTCHRVFFRSEPYLDHEVSLAVMMNIAHSIPSAVSSISFSFLSTEDIRRISVKQIVNPVLLDDLNRPNIGGLYDPALGPSDRQDLYVSCPSY